MSWQIIAILTQLESAGLPMYTELVDKSHNSYITWKQDTKDLVSVYIDKSKERWTYTIVHGWNDQIATGVLFPWALNKLKELLKEPG